MLNLNLKPVIVETELKDLFFNVLKPMNVEMILSEMGENGVSETLKGFYIANTEDVDTFTAVGETKIVNFYGQAVRLNYEKEMVKMQSVDGKDYIMEIYVKTNVFSML